MSEYEPSEEKGLELIIAVRTVPTTAERIRDTTYKGYVTTLRADPSNTGNIYVGRREDICTYPFDADDVQVTKVDLGKLWWKSDNGTDKMHIWAEKAC